MKFSLTTVRVSSAIAGIAAIAFVMSAGAPSTPEEAAARKQARAEQAQKYQQESEAKAQAKAEAKKAEELAEAQESYNYYCHQYGYNYAAATLGAVSKYEVRANAALKGMKQIADKNPGLNQKECQLQAEGGAMFAGRDWRDNEIEAARR